jgi:hypothetical protein
VPSPPPDQISIYDTREIDLDVLLQKQEWFQPICNCNFEPFVNSGPIKADARKSPLKLSVKTDDCGGCSKKRSLGIQGNFVARKRQDSGFFDSLDLSFQT